MADMSTSAVDRDETNSLISAQKVRGTTVYDAAGDRIGTVDDIMLTKVEGSVAYAVMSFGGFLGIGEKYHPLPWDVLDYDTDLGGYRVSTTGESFRDAPSYSRDAFEQDDWEGTTRRYYDEAASSGRIGRRTGSSEVGNMGPVGETGTLTGGGMVGGRTGGGTSGGAGSMPGLDRDQGPVPNRNRNDF